MTFLLEAQGLEVRPSGAQRVLASIASLEVEAGDVLAIVGESGAGKSSLVRALVALERLEAGRVHFDGVLINGEKGSRPLGGRALQRLRRRFQLVHQDPAAALNPRMTIAESVAEGPLHHGLWARSEAPQRVAAMLRSLGLDEDLASRFPSEVSGGQRRRAALGRVLALEPDLLVLDEMSAGLDAERARQVLDLVLDAARPRKTAVVLVSHDLALIEGRVKRVLVMRQGRVVEEGEAAELYRNPRDPYTRELLSAARGDSAWMAD